MKNCRGKKGKTEAGWKNIATCLPYFIKGGTFEGSKQHTKKGKTMRIIIEDMDVYNWETKLCYSKVATLKRLNFLAEHWTKTAENPKSAEFQMILCEFETIKNHVIRGTLGPGDSVGIDWDGMTIKLSVLVNRGKHS